jgi:hypothetical protein
LLTFIFTPDSVFFIVRFSRGLEYMFQEALKILGIDKAITIIAFDYLASLC